MPTIKGFVESVQTELSPESATMADREIKYRPSAAKITVYVSITDWGQVPCSGTEVRLTWPPAPEVKA